MQLAVLIALVVAIGAVAFALQNDVPVSVTLLVWRFDSALAMVLLLAAALGALVVALLSTLAVLAAPVDRSAAKRQIAALEQANNELRAHAAQIAAQVPRGTPQAGQASGLAAMAPRRP